MDEPLDNSQRLIVPDLRELHAVGLPRSPVSDATCFLGDQGSITPLAATCLNDSFYMVEEARFALCEGLKQLTYYRDKETPNEQAGVFFAQFYGADVALRLYAAGEHLANAIVEMLGLDRSRLAGNKKDRESLQSRVGKYLAAKMPTHPITMTVGEIYGSNKWKRAIKYRNDWVHQQAPLISGLGLAFKRGKRYWQKFEDQFGGGYELTFGGGDPPETSADELLQTMHGAFCDCFSALRALAVHYDGLICSAAAKVHKATMGAVKCSTTPARGVTLTFAFGRSQPPAENTGADSDNPKN